MDTPSPRRDAAFGFDQSYLILFGGRTQTGLPLQDCYSFNLDSGTSRKSLHPLNKEIILGQWDTLRFPSPPPGRYGMGSANSINGGLYIFGGFGFQGSSINYNPYLSLGAASQQQITNYNYATPPNFMQNPTLMNNPDFVNNPHYNPMSGTGYNHENTYNDNDDTVDENYYPLQDAWFLNYAYVFDLLLFFDLIF
jgi:hypothetical protein